MIKTGANGTPETVDVTVTVTDGTNPIDGVVVTLTDSEDNDYATSDSGTGAAGGATIKDVPYGSYNVTATKNGYNDYESSITVDATNHSISIVMTANIGG